ncbi:MAG: hypothetical protein BM564_12045 [Bacteroidetes bacterium MedPE-SWsnd-G2]|mgnify:CR=1 FL=1|nr:MAG: hypothetical protein BM564_12045 [Bacteroidetes bacterium MedPE-SWsnd-G2]
MSNKPKISIITIDMGTGGTERVISLLLPHLIKDFEVTLCIFYNYIDFDIPKEVETVILIPNQAKRKSLVFKLKNLAILTSRYRKLVKSKNIEISISFLPIPNIINSILKKLNPSLKTILSERCYSSEMYRNTPQSMRLAKLCFPIFYNLNDKLFSNSVYINKDLQDNFGVKLPLSVIYNPLNALPQNQIVETDIIEKENFNLITVGALYEPKNQELIIRAIYLLKAPNLHLTLLGSGPLEQELKKESKTLKLTENVHFKGKVSNVTEYLSKSDCFILSSNTEGFPNVILEALAVGLPVISTNCMSGPIELLNENQPVSINKGEFICAKYGILINPNDEIALSKAINHLRSDLNLRRAYSNKSKIRAQDFALPKIYNEFKTLITT